MPTGQSQLLVKICIYPFQMANMERLICGNFCRPQFDIWFSPGSTVLPTHEVPVSALTTVEVFEHTGVPLGEPSGVLCVLWLCPSIQIWIKVTFLREDWKTWFMNITKLIFMAGWMGTFIKILKGVSVFCFLLGNLKDHQTDCCIHFHCHGAAKWQVRHFSFPNFLCRE